MPPPSNRCPACGPVEPELSSRYCLSHMQELQASCLAETLELLPEEVAPVTARWTMPVHSSAWPDQVAARVQG